MALEPESLYEAETSVDPFPMVDIHNIAPKTFASSAGAELLKRLTPVAFNNSTELWVVWTNGGANDTGTIRGFVGMDEVQLSATGEVIGNVLMAGKINYDDIVLPAGELEADLKAALQSGVRERGLTIQNLEKVR